jgi:Transglutaminase-like superfamily
MQTQDYYLQPGTMTTSGRYQPLLADLPRGIAALAEVAHGLLIHEHITGPYGVTLTEERRASVHVRPAAALLERILAEDSRPLTVAREPAERLPGNCRHFTVLAVAMLRAQGTPARARCGFGGYFGSGMFEDHWVCEYWDEAARGWKLADVQIDDVQLKLFDVDFDLMDVPRDKFLVAGDAWRLCRGGGADPATFGLSLLNEGGYWWIAANLLRDVAALNNMEMLPWDVWGAMPAPDETISDELYALFDRLAGLTGDPDAAFAELTTAYADDSRLHVPATVYNAVLNRPEPVLGEDRGSNPPP